jgi:hypothetical protein
MTQLSQGFYLERIAVVGPGVDTAEVEFRDGLNVVAGASDTGKSYLCSLVDFVFGASSPPRVIEQAKRYARVVARLRDRRSGVARQGRSSAIVLGVRRRPHATLSSERPGSSRANRP